MSHGHSVIHPSSFRLLPEPGAVQRAAGDRLVDVEVAVADLDVEAALGVGAGPGLEVDGGALAPEIGERHQVAALALLAFRESWYHHAAPRPRIAASIASGWYARNESGMAEIGGMWRLAIVGGSVASAAPRPDRARVNLRRVAG